MLENEIAELEESLDRVIEGSEEDKDISLELKEKVKEYCKYLKMFVPRIEDCAHHGCR